MTVALDHMASYPTWYYVPDDAPLGDDEAMMEFFDDHDGELIEVGGDDDRGLTLDEACKIADTYGGGEFDGEMNAIVHAMLVLRKAVTPENVEGHNHITRDIKPLGQCPACDRYHNRTPENVDGLT